MSIFAVKKLYILFPVRHLPLQMYCQPLLSNFGIKKGILTDTRIPRKREITALSYNTVNLYLSAVKLQDGVHWACPLFVWANSDTEYMVIATLQSEKEIINVTSNVIHYSPETVQYTKIKSVRANTSYNRRKLLKNKQRRYMNVTFYILRWSMDTTALQKSIFYEFHSGHHISMLTMKALMPIMAWDGNSVFPGICRLKWTGEWHAFLDHRWTLYQVSIGMWV